MNKNTPKMILVLGVLTLGLPAGKLFAEDNDYPQFLGSNRNSIAANEKSLAKNWAADQPRVLWRIPLYEGYAPPVISAGRIYIMDYKPAQVPNSAQDLIRCLALDTGKEIWTCAYDVNYKF